MYRTIMLIHMHAANRIPRVTWQSIKATHLSVWSCQYIRVATRNHHSPYRPKVPTFERYLFAEMVIN